jgi:CRP-like cAMP-binding protein
MDKTQAEQIMRARGWFSRQPTDFQRELMSRSVLRRFEEGESLYHAGDPVAGVFGLVEGTIKIEFPVAGATYCLASVRQPGFWTGEAAAFRLGNRLATNRIAAPSYVLHLPLAEFERMIADPSYCRCFAILTVEHLDEAISVLANMMAGTADSRVASRLVMLAQKNGFSSSADLNITQSDLAEMCALTRQTVQQVLRKLEIQGLVTNGYRKITIPDVGSLAAAAGVESRFEEDAAGRGGCVASGREAGAGG